MKPPHDLPTAIAHVRAQNRHTSIAGILLAEIDRQAAEIHWLRVYLHSIPADAAVTAAHSALRYADALRQVNEETPDV